MAQMFLQVKISSPQEILFNGKARSVSSKNSRGPFDILPEHANFITIIENQNIDIVDEKGAKMTIKVEQGILHQANDIVSIYTNIPNDEMLSEINKSKAI